MLHLSDVRREAPKLNVRDENDDPEYNDHNSEVEICKYVSIDVR